MDEVRWHSATDVLGDVYENVQTSDGRDQPRV